MSSDDVKRGRRPGVKVDPAAIRSARLAAGLSLAELAGGSVTRQAMHQIENGRARPSMEVLSHIAERTGRSVQDFYKVGTTQAEGHNATRIAALNLDVERLMETRNYAEAAAAADRLLGSVVGTGDEGRLRLLLGEALVMCRRHDEALQNLRLARAQLDDSGDSWGTVDAIDWEAMALFLKDDPNCLPLLTQALERCTTLQPVVEMTRFRILTHIAAVHISRHAWREAVRFYEAAAKASDSVRDLAQIARAYDGLSQAYAQLRHRGQALAYANKAIGLYSAPSDLAGVWRAENNLGDLLLQLGEIDAAKPHLQRALQGCQSIGLDRRGRGTALGDLVAVTLWPGGTYPTRAVVNPASALPE